MAKSIRDPTKSKRKTGRVVRMHDKQIDAIDAWIAMQVIEVTRPEAIRRLVEIGLKAWRPPTKVTIKPSPIERAAELAAHAIDGMIDPNALPEERDRRRLRLTKGPLEFREDRVDQLKN